MRFLPSDSPAVRIALGGSVLDLPRIGARAEAYVTSVPMLYFGNETRPVVGRVGRIEFGETVRCARVRFHLPNFLENEISKDGGYAITHVGVVERIDGSALSLNDSEPVLDCLGHYLSFCRGSWTFPVLLCAENAEGCVVGQRWELSNTIDRYKQTRPWLPRNEPEGTHLSEAFRGYAYAWFSALWGDAIRIATQWYVESSSGAVEKSIILTQAAFELLGWTRLVEDTHTLSEKVWKSRSMSFAEKLRQLLQSCTVPLSVPAELDQLLAYSKALRVSDGPEALTSLRNALVHPSPSKRKRIQEHPGATVDAWKLGLWYLDLIFLHVCGYKSRYSNKTIWGWPADDAMAVPWV